MKKIKLPFKVKAVDPKDNKFKNATVVNKYSTSRGEKCDLVFENSEKISKGHFLKFLIIKDKEE